MQEQPPQLLKLKKTNQPNPLLQFDREIRKAGFPTIAGIDEVGRGPLAGPVVAAAVVLPEDWFLEGITDSKKLTEKQRNYYFEEITKNAITIGIGCISQEIIDKINILQATFLAMKEAFSRLSLKPDCLVIDAVCLPECQVTQKSYIKGDSKSFSIAAASIIAKVNRDQMMRNYDKLYPQYGFASHKGYGTQEHYSALRVHGPCPIHRKTFLGKLSTLELF